MSLTEQYMGAIMAENYSFSAKPAELENGTIQELLLHIGFKKLYGYPSDIPREHLTYTMNENDEIVFDSDTKAIIHAMGDWGYKYASISKESKTEFLKYALRYRILEMGKIRKVMHEFDIKLNRAAILATITDELCRYVTDPRSSL